MPSYRIGQAAALLGVSVDTVRRWADAGRLSSTRTPGGHRMVDGAGLAALAAAHHRRPEAERGAGRSARNRLTGIVTNVQRDDLTAQVELQAGPFRVVSLMTREAADELELAPGVLAVAAIKATNVVVERPG